MKSLSTMRSSLFQVGVLALLPAWLSGAPVEPAYVVTDIGGLTSTGDANPRAINASGDVVGTSSVPCNPAFPLVCTRAFLYSSSTGLMTQLGTIGDGNVGYYSTAFGINAGGDAVGSLPESVPNFSYPGRAVLFPAGGGSEFLPLGTPSVALAINDSGLIAGSTGPAPFGPNQAFLYDPASGSVTDIHAEIANAWGSQATAINAGGDVAGWFDRHLDPDNPWPVRRTAFVRHPDGSLDVLALPNGLETDVEPTGVNASGQVVGTTNMTSQSTPVRAILWSGGAAQDLGTLAPNEPAAMALGINRVGQVVGASSFGVQCWPSYCARAWHAFLYSNGVMRDLNDLIPSESGWVLYGAMAINDAGQIVATGMNGGRFGAVLLTPSAQALAGSLIDLVRGFGLPQGTETSLVSKLENALAALAAGDTATACSLVQAFINETRAQAGKKITEAQAAQMISAAEQIRAAIGCS